MYAATGPINVLTSGSRPHAGKSRRPGRGGRSVGGIGCGRAVTYPQTGRANNSFAQPPSCKRYAVYYLVEAWPGSNCDGTESDVLAAAEVGAAVRTQA